MEENEVKTNAQYSFAHYSFARFSLAHRMPASANKEQVETMKHNLLIDTCRLLRSWLQTDRIRTAPGVGKLLNLPCGSWLLIHQELYQIVHCENDSDERSATTTYALDTESHAAQESVTMIVSTSLCNPRGSILFIRGSKTIEAFYNDVTVLSARRSRDLNQDSRPVECLDK